MKKEVKQISLLEGGKVRVELFAAGGRKAKAQDVVAAILKLTDEEKMRLNTLKVASIFSAPDKKNTKAA